VIYGIEVITKGNNEISEIQRVMMGRYGKRETLWSIPIDLDKIQVRPGLEGHGVKKWDSTHEIEIPKSSQFRLEGIRSVKATPESATY